MKGKEGGRKGKGGKIVVGESPQELTGNNPLNPGRRGPDPTLSHQDIRSDESTQVVHKEDGEDEEREALRAEEPKPRTRLRETPIGSTSSTNGAVHPTHVTNILPLNRRIRTQLLRASNRDHGGPSS